MAVRDLVNSISVAQSIVPAVQTATATGTSVDTKGFESVTVLINTGAIVSAGNVTPKLQACDDNSTWVDVGAADLIGSFPTALAASTAYKVGYKGPRRYVRVVGTLNSGTSVAFGAMVVEGHAWSQPAA